MNNSIVTTSYKQNGIAIRREVFASYPAQAIIIHLSASKPVLNFTAHLESPHPVTQDSDSQAIYLKGQAPAHAQRRDIEHMKLSILNDCIRNTLTKRDMSYKKSK